MAASPKRDGAGFKPTTNGSGLKTGTTGGGVSVSDFPKGEAKNKTGKTRAIGNTARSK